MENSEKICDIQKRLFEEIQKNFPVQYALVEVVSEVLHIGLDAAYRRIRCDKLLSIEETYTLCKHFKLSFDALTGVKDIHLFNCTYHPINLSQTNEYLNYIISLTKSVDILKTTSDSSMLMTATDIPVFHSITQKELMFFKIYTWFHSVYNYEGALDDFMQEIDMPEILSCYQKIISDYEIIPSAEIWTENTIDATLRLIIYYVEICKFADKNLPLQLCQQVLTILYRLEKWAENSGKGKHGIPFQFYLSEIKLENTFILMKHSGLTNCVVKLFTTNSLNVMDQDFCSETEQWLNRLTQRSVLLCGNSEKERIKFFNAQRQKVRVLIDKIEHYNFE